ncbi:MAG TPA: PAS domain S-box protein [Stenomitos sp.]
MIGNVPFFQSSPNPKQSTASFERRLPSGEASGMSSVLQHSLEHTEDFYNLIFSCITDVFLITEPTGKLLFISPNIEQICGYSKSEVQEKFDTITQLLGDNLIQPQNQEYWRESLNIEQKITDKFGQQRTLSINVKPIALGSGKFLYSCRDMTPSHAIETQLPPIVNNSVVDEGYAHPTAHHRGCECHQMEVRRYQSTELKQAPQEYYPFSLAIPAESATQPTAADFFTLSLDMLCVAGFDGYFKHLNPAWERTLGFTQAELQRQPYLDFVHPEDYVTTLAEAQMLITGVDTIEFENRYHCKDGSYKWLLWKATPCVQQKLIYAVAHDITARKEAEEARREQAAILRSFYNSSPLMMGVVELLDDDILHLSDNPTTAQFFGTTPDAMQYQRASHLGAPLAHIQQWIENYQESERTGTPIRFEYQHRTATDSRWLSATVCLIGTAANGRSRFSYIVEDITERKQSEETLRRHLAAVEAAMDGIAIANAQQEYTYLNQAHVKLFGYDSSTQLLGKTWHKLYPSDEIQRLEQDVLPILLQTGQWHGEAIAKKRDGSTFAEEISLTLTDDGGIICVCRDITERKQFEAQLRWDQAFLRSMTSASPLAFFVVDNRTDRILYFNHRFCEIWGIEHLEEAMQRGELKNNDIIPACIPLLADVAAFAESCKPLQTEENRAVVEDEIPFVGGRTIRRFSAQIRDEGDRYFGRLYMFEEITERKQAEQALRELTQREHEKAIQLERALQELQHTQAQLVQKEKMASLGQLVAGVAHEINNPTSFIYGNIYPASEYAQDLLHLVDLYQRHYPHPVAEIAEQLEHIEPEFIAEDFPKLLDSMKEGAERITQIVLSLRNFSRLDETELKPVNIHEGIDSTLLILQHRLKPKPNRPEIQVIREYEQLPLVECYPGQINQVFMNILSNAIDALEEADELASMKDERQDSCELSPTIWIRTAQVEPNQVMIRIADNGVSIPVDIQPRLFDPFFTTKPPGKGTGLGLSISYQIVVERHQGKLLYHSALTQGTEFVIELPIERSEANERNSA